MRLALALLLAVLLAAVACGIRGPPEPPLQPNPKAELATPSDGGLVPRGDGGFVPPRRGHR